MVLTKIKSENEYNEKLRTLEDLSIGNPTLSREDDILFEKLLTEILEYDEYICPESVFEENNKTMIAT
jgi:hypothetical protein